MKNFLFFFRKLEEVPLSMKELFSKNSFNFLLSNLILIEIIEKNYPLIYVKYLMTFNHRLSDGKLVEKRTKIYAEDALCLAAYTGRLDVVKYLLAKGADIHSDIDEVLVIASMKGNLKIVKYLVEKGVNIHFAHQALSFAAMHGKLEIVKYLVEKGTDIHILGELALDMASREGHLDIVKYLVEKGADYHIIRKESIFAPINKNRINVIEYLKSLK